ncbi:MAG: hypothetical protein EZS28_032288, partial [Streblomastix strix]
VLTKETIKDHIDKWMLKGFDLIPLGKDDEGQYWPGFGPGVPHATDWKKEHHFDLRVAYVRKEYDSEDDSDTLQPTKATRQEFRNRFGRFRNRSLSPHYKRSRYDSSNRGNESRERSGSRGYSISREYQGLRETRTDADRNFNGFESRNEPRGRGRETTHQYDDKNRGEGWYDNPNDDWTKRTQMQKDPPDNLSDRDSTWTEDEVPQHQVATPLHKQPVLQSQIVQIVSPLPRKISTGMNKDKPVIQSQLPATPTQKPVHRAGFKQRLKKTDRELEQSKAKQQLQQQENNDFNNTNVEIPDIQGTVGQLIGLQPSSGAQSSGLNAGLRLKEAGSISASNSERTEPQINESHEDNSNEEEKEQTDEATLKQNKDYRVIIISQLPVLENLGTQQQNNQGLNSLSQMEKDNKGFAPGGVQEKPKQGRGSKKSKTEGLNASDENQGNNAQAQTKTTSKVPKPKSVSKRGRKAAEEVKPEPKNSNNESKEEYSL